jgi:hypothetical protein
MAWAIDEPPATCARVFSSQALSASRSGLVFCCRAARRSSALLPRISASISYSSAIRFRASMAVGAGGDLAMSNH